MRSLCAAAREEPLLTAPKTQGNQKVKQKSKKERRLNLKKKKKKKETKR